MLFPTLTFAAFFAVVLPVSWWLRARPVRWKLFILGASYLFYGYWNWKFLFLLAAATIANEVFGVAIHRAATSRSRHVLLAAAVAFNLGVLGVFKYYRFFIESFNDLLGTDSAISAIALPIGISFFTFQALSYVIDIARGNTGPAPLLDFAVYLAFFPQLVAGPIVRATEFLPQVRTRRPPDRVALGHAAVLIGQGVFKKVVISSYLASAIVDDTFALPDQHSSLEVLVGVYAYAIQIYADFSGYTDIAIGVALLLGFRFPLNFDRPLTATSLQDFWRRWHMTLSRWLRDYLYFPLGGNRKGRVATYRNLLIVMVLGGLWHGAGANFAVWGLIHGLGLAGERLLAAARGEHDRPLSEADIRIQEIGALHSGDRLAPWRPDPTSPTPFAPVQVRRLWLGRVLTFHFVCLAWIPFRAGNLPGARDVFLRLFTGWTDLSTTAITPMLLAVIAAMIAVQLVPRLYARQAIAAFSRIPVALQGAAAGLALAASVALAPLGVQPFIYFQF
ncbi:MAG: MBOAT family protein [Acidimicrobiales bacterium]|nr:MBOAT family protein [Acidimicrobiales bacterium]